MKQNIVGYVLDEEEEGVWKSKLECRHYQHIRHNPPLISRPWVETAAGRDKFLGFPLDCKKCDENAPPDW